MGAKNLLTLSMPDLKFWNLSKKRLRVELTTSFFSVSPVAILVTWRWQNISCVL